jgi:hypothetical protein
MDKRKLLAVVMSGVYPWYIAFNGSNTSIICGKGNGLDDLTAGAFTAECWFNSAVTAFGNTRYFFRKGSNTGWEFYIDSSGIKATVYCQTTSASIQVYIAAMNDGLWHHSRFTWDNAGDRKIYLYLDGKLIGTSGAGDGAIKSDAASDMYIGNRASGDRAMLGGLRLARLSTVVRNTGDFYPNESPYVIDANTVAQWNMTTPGNTIVNSEGTVTRNGTLTNGSFTKYTYQTLARKLGRAAANNAATALTTPTYDASGEVVHPAVLDLGVATWNGYRYWMAITPYPNANASLENPSILASNDKTTWEVPAGLTNPIYACPSGGYNADPCLVFEGVTLYCIWLTGHADASKHFYESHSTDGITWSTATSILDQTTGHSWFSPAIIWDGTQYRMFTVDATLSPTTPFPIEMRTCATLTGTWSAPVVVNMPSSATAGIWHFDILADGNVLYVVIFSLNPNALWLGISTDWGLNWTTGSSAFLNLVAGAWDAALYKAALVKTATGFDIWYGGHTATVWHIGYAPVAFTLY